MKWLEMLRENDVDLGLEPGQTRELILAQIDKLHDMQNKIHNLGGYKMNVSFQEPDPEHAGINRKFAELLHSIDTKIQKLEARLEQMQTESSDLEDLLNDIDRNCSQYIAAVQASNGRWLYRGMPHKPSYFIGRSSLDRRPRDSSPVGQEIMDRILASAGIAALRSKSIFCTPDYEHAKGYASGSTGKVYMIFPVNGFAFHYTTRADLIIDRYYWSNYWIPPKVNEFAQRMRLWLDNNEEEAMEVRDLHDFVLARGTSEESRTILSYAENYLRDPNRYQMLPDSLHATVDNILDLLDVPSILNDLQPQDEDLAKFLQFKSGEICISGSYYALERDSFMRYAQRKWL